MPKITQLPTQMVPLNLSSASAYGSMPMQRAIDSGMAFLNGELEKLDTKMLEPLTSVTWMRDIPVKTGGGLVENIASFNVDYATSGGNNNGVHGKQANQIPVMQADMNKDTYRVFLWSHILRVPFVDQQLLQKIGRSLPDILDKGIHLAHDKTVDMNAYEGLEDQGTYGLVNNPNVITDTASASWIGKDPVEIAWDVNYMLNETWAASEYDLTGMANHILIPPKQYAYINQTPITTDAAKSILTYLLENNIARNQGRDLFIGPSRWCEGAGAGGTDRMVAYANDEDRVRMEITQPLHRIMTQASAEHLAYLTPYLSQFSEVMWLFFQHAMYMDGI